MSFWEDLDTNIKRFIIFGAVLFVAVLAFRSCAEPDPDGKLPPRGIQQGR
ncbi:MAG: hypothetical protein OEZ06_18360 [Myxococcales bacterium]|nr:hypothetical protein [Myxococcales bacterium]